MDTKISETTVASVTQFLPRWDVKLIWDIEDFAAVWALGRPLNSGNKFLENNTLRKSLNCALELQPLKDVQVIPANLNIQGDNVYYIEYCTYEIMFGEPGMCSTENVQKLEPQYPKVKYHGFYKYGCEIPLAYLKDCQNKIGGTLRITIKLRVTFQLESKPGVRELEVGGKLSPPTEKWIPSLFNNELFSDISIKCQGRVFAGHKIILGQSSVFKAMFLTAMKEATSNEVIIPDIAPNIFEYFLKSLYGRSFDLPAQTSGLLQLIDCAEKYDISAIKYACFEKLVTMLSDDNAAELTVAAHRYCHEEELGGIRNYFRKYCQERHQILIQNPDYKRIFTQHLVAFI